MRNVLEKCFMPGLSSPYSPLEELRFRHGADYFFEALQDLWHGGPFRGVVLDHIFHERLEEVHAVIPLKGFLQRYKVSLVALQHRFSVSGIIRCKKAHLSELYTNQVANVVHVRRERIHWTTYILELGNSLISS